MKKYIVGLLLTGFSSYFFTSCYELDLNPLLSKEIFP